MRWDENCLGVGPSSPLPACGPQSQIASSVQQYELKSWLHYRSSPESLKQTCTDPSPWGCPGGRRGGKEGKHFALVARGTGHLHPDPWYPRLPAVTHGAGRGASFRAEPELCSARRRSQEGRGLLTAHLRTRYLVPWVRSGAAKALGIHTVPKSLFNRQKESPTLVKAANGKESKKVARYWDYYLPSPAGLGAGWCC